MKDTILDRAELFALLEYSCSLPTGTTIGKQWRCDVHAYRKKAIPKDQHEWQIGEYTEDTDPGMVGIRWTWAVDANHSPHRGKRLKLFPAGDASPG